jgi:hypothetical protein
VSKTTKKKKTTLSKKNSDTADSTGNKIQSYAQQVSDTGSVDKIRDIIFGNQMRDYETRFDRLEDRLLKEINDMRDEAGKRFDSFERYVNKELESLGSRLKAEQDARVDAEKKLTGDIKDNSRLLSKNLDRLDGVQSSDTRELRQQLLELNKTLSAEIRKKDKEASRALDQAAKELRTDKVDRSAFAETLMEIALRMSDELAEKLNLKTEDIKNE